MSSLLTTKQSEELRLAILDYFHVNGFTNSFQALQSEAIIEDYNGDGKQRYSGLLEKNGYQSLDYKRRLWN
jgi:platelet-activating factor acetylhydrolase IB subunit alpha